MIAASCALALGCGGSDEHKDASSHADAGSSRDRHGKPTDAGSGGTSAGTGGAGSGAGSGGTSAGTGGENAAEINNPNVPCGPTRCAGTDPATGMAMVGGQLGLRLSMTCCADESLGICGAVATDNTCVAPLPTDADCPLVMGQPGCCADGTECGIDLSLFGQGCRALSTVSVPLKLRVQFGLPDPIGCDGKPLLPDAGHFEDAGM